MCLLPKLFQAINYAVVVRLFDATPSQRPQYNNKQLMAQTKAYNKVGLSESARYNAQL